MGSEMCIRDSHGRGGVVRVVDVVDDRPPWPFAPSPRYTPTMGGIDGIDPDVSPAHHLDVRGKRAREPVSSVASRHQDVVRDGFPLQTNLASGLTRGHGHPNPAAAPRAFVWGGSAQTLTAVKN